MTVKNGALFPGAGVSKKIPPVGDISITGIVNIAGALEHLTLQTTRLSFVIALADQIAQGTTEKKYHYGRCDIGSPFAKGTPFDVSDSCQ